MGFRTWLRRQPPLARALVVVPAVFAVEALFAVLFHQVVAKTVRGGAVTALSLVGSQYLIYRTSAEHVTRDLDLDDDDETED